MSEESAEYVTIAEVRQELGISRQKVADLVKRGVLPSEENPFDRRSKLVRRSDLEALKRKMPRTLKSAA